ncbi:MAG TPA: DUF1573 domain-containing protein [Bacteroidales bacterium]|nr:DUF1573 domain-containing protein [Paludibacteraceae bacterium]HPT02077.1 DUF1573 domain-containing protein [Bacteroidales bacterium]
MKKIILLLAVIAACGWANAQPSVHATANEKAISNPNGPKARFDKMINDFGEIDRGIPKTAEFTITNDGKEPLIIQKAQASCGCTNLKYSQEPILSGKSAVISVTFNAASVGPFMKTITVTTNAEASPSVLQIKGTVVKKE